jgi:hypothetical protein
VGLGVPLTEGSCTFSLFRTKEGNEATELSLTDKLSKTNSSSRHQNKTVSKRRSQFTAHTPDEMLTYQYAAYNPDEMLAHQAMPTTLHTPKWIQLYAG